MLAVTHTLTSVAIGTQIHNPVLAFSAALVFHFIADTFLHWNIYIGHHRFAYAWTAVDVLGGLAIAFLLLGQGLFTPPILAAILGGNLPDIAHGLLDLWNLVRARRGQSNIQPAIARFHHGIQWETLNPWKGLVWQIVFLAVSVALIK